MVHQRVNNAINCLVIALNAMNLVKIELDCLKELFNRCYDLLTMPMNLSDITFLNIKSVDYSCTISGISKREKINFIRNIALIEKSETL